MAATSRDDAGSGPDWPLDIHDTLKQQYEVGQVCYVPDVAVLDNGHFGETGMQLSHSGLGARLDVVAQGAGFASVTEITDLMGSPTSVPACRTPAVGRVLPGSRLHPAIPSARCHRGMARSSRTGCDSISVLR